MTLYRMVKLFQLKIKWKYEFYKFIDTQLMEIIKDPEVIERKIMPYLAEVIHNSAEKQRL